MNILHSSARIVFFEPNWDPMHVDGLRESVIPRWFQGIEIVQTHQVKSVKGVKSVQRIVCGGCLDFKVVTALDADAFGAWEESKFAPEEKFLEKIKAIEGVTQVCEVKNGRKHILSMAAKTRELRPELTVRPPWMTAGGDADIHPHAHVGVQ